MYVPVSHIGQFPLPPLGKLGDFFFGEYKTEDLCTQGHHAQMRERRHTKNWRLSKPIPAKCWFTPLQVFFLTMFPELKTYFYVSLTKVVSHAQS